MRWKRKNPGRYKLGQHPKDITTVASRLEKRQAFLAGHKHKCIRCPRTYACTNACSPDGDDSKNSICEPCFVEVQCA